MVRGKVGEIPKYRQVTCHCVSQLRDTTSAYLDNTRVSEDTRLVYELKLGWVDLRLRRYMNPGAPSCLDSRSQGYVTFGCLEPKTHYLVNRSPG